MKKVLFIAILACLTCACKKDVTKDIENAKKYMALEACAIEEDCENVSEFWRETIYAIYGRGYIYVDRKGRWISERNQNGTGMAVDNVGDALNFYTEGKLHESLCEKISRYQDSCQFFISKLKNAKDNQLKACEQVHQTYKALLSYKECTDIPGYTLDDFERECKRRRLDFMDEYDEIDYLLK